MVQLPDLDGNFVLEVNNGDVIQVSFIGYITQEIKYTGQATLAVNLVEDTQKLEEVVVVGYGTQKKVNMTGAVAKLIAKCWKVVLCRMCLQLYKESSQG